MDSDSLELNPDKPDPQDSKKTKPDIEDIEKSINLSIENPAAKKTEAAPIPEFNLDDLILDVSSGENQETAPVKADLPQSGEIPDEESLTGRDFEFEDLSLDINDEPTPSAGTDPPGLTDTGPSKRNGTAAVSENAFELDELDSMIEGSGHAPSKDQPDMSQAVLSEKSGESQVPGNDDIDPDGIDFMAENSVNLNDFDFDSHETEPAAADSVPAARAANNIPPPPEYLEEDVPVPDDIEQEITVIPPGPEDEIPSDSVTAEKKPPKKKKSALLVLLLIIAAGGFLYFQFIGGNKNNSKSSAVKTAPQLSPDEIQRKSPYVFDKAKNIRTKTDMGITTISFASDSPVKDIHTYYITKLTGMGYKIISDNYSDDKTNSKIVCEKDNKACAVILISSSAIVEAYISYIE